MEQTVIAGDPVSQIVGLLLSFGLPGVIIIALGYAYHQKDKRVGELQGTLFELGKEMAKIMEANTASINRLSDVLSMRGGLRNGGGGE